MGSSFYASPFVQRELVGGREEACTLVRPPAARRSAERCCSRRQEGGGRLPRMELARRLTTSASGVTRQVLPLERMGLVEREPGHWPLRDDGSVELP